MNRTLPLTRVAARKTEPITTLEVTDMCQLHKNCSHPLNDCMSFRQKPIGDRKKMILTNGICFKCCSGKKHRAKNCKADVKCSECQTSLHPTALHEEPSEAQDFGRYAVKNRKGNPYEGENRPIVSSACTKVHGASKSCAKIVPVLFPIHGSRRWFMRLSTTRAIGHWLPHQSLTTPRMKAVMSSTH